MFVTFEKGDYVKIADNILGVAVNEERAITVSIEKVPNDNNNYHLGNQPICSGDKKASMLIEDIKEIAVSDPRGSKNTRNHQMDNEESS